MRYQDRFTERAQSALTKAQEAAQEMGHSYVGTEHILLGIAQESEGIGAKVLHDNGLDEELITELIEKFVGRGTPGVPVSGLTPNAKRVVELAIMCANQLGHSFIGTEHLLMALLREPDCAATRLIVSTGADVNKLYTDIVDIFRSSDYHPQQSQPTQAASAGRSGGKGKSDTKTLDQFSRDLNKAAQNG